MREGFSELVTSEQRPVGAEEASMQLLRKRAFQKERLTIAKGVRQDLAWHVEEVTRNQLCCSLF